ncbi:nitronate monooxygenase, partial [Candidatus Latescibacterota bacterium]
MSDPDIIQGGMGAGVSSWHLARTVSLNGALGVVSGTALDTILARRLQQGDPGGHMRRAMAAFPFPEVVEHVLERYYVPDGKGGDEPYKAVPFFRIRNNERLLQLTVLANFVEVYLAKEGHEHPVGINYLEKIQMPHLPSLYGAMLASVDYVLMGAGIPRQIPGALDALSRHRGASYKLYVEGASGTDAAVRFDPQETVGPLSEPLKRPQFLAIVASATLALSLHRKATGEVNGFIVEGPTAGGHNAAPRGPMSLDEGGEPVYGSKDVVDLQKIADIGKPFWLAGGFGGPGGLGKALALGAAGIQVGTAFFLCEESSVDPGLRNSLLERLSREEISVFTDPVASPTGFPFKVVSVEGTASEEQEYADRTRVCDLGYLRVPYEREDGTIDYRCPSEPVDTYQKKGGDLSDTVGRKCLCNGLMANIGQPQFQRGDYVERPLLTAGNDINLVRIFLQDGKTSYSAVDVIKYLQE